MLLPITRTVAETKEATMSRLVMEHVKSSYVCLDNISER